VLVDHKARASQRFEVVGPQLREISRWMYHHPEIAHEEHDTSARLVAFLREQGFHVEYPAYGLETAFAAGFGTEGPEIVICAEMDALPGVGHACGHNIIATAALGAGVALAGLTGDLGFRVTVLGTPAEEKIGGKIDLIRAGAFEGAAAAMMIHPASEDALDPVMLAVLHLEVEFHGKDAHAASSPWEGRNALDAFVQAYTGVAVLRQQMRRGDKVHCIVTHGGDAPNIIPSRIASEWYVRAATKERLEELMGRVDDCFAAAARATGCTYTVADQGHAYDDLVTDPLLADLLEANAGRLGRTLPRTLPGSATSSGSTDMGNVSHEVPSIHPMIGMDTGGAVNHQPEFAAHTITPDGDRAMRDGALAMAWTVIDLAEGDRWRELGGR
jgi:amidohydrolase